jgi:hypothetical protein
MSLRVQPWRMQSSEAGARLQNEKVARSAKVERPLRGRCQCSGEAAHS